MRSARNDNQKLPTAFGRTIGQRRRLTAGRQLGFPQFLTARRIVGTDIAVSGANSTIIA